MPFLSSLVLKAENDVGNSPEVPQKVTCTIPQNPAGNKEIREMCVTSVSFMLVILNSSNS